MSALLIGDGNLFLASALTVSWRRAPPSGCATRLADVPPAR
jgi:hypothetical protein